MRKWHWFYIIGMVIVLFVGTIFIPQVDDGYEMEGRLLLWLTIICLLTSFPILFSWKNRKVK